MEQAIRTSNQEKQRFTSIPSTSSSTTNSTATFSESLLNEQMKDLREEWRENLSSDMPGWLQRQLRLRLEDGLDYLVVIYALREAGMAPRPSWKYAEAVMIRCIREKRSGVWLLEEQRQRLELSW